MSAPERKVELFRQTIAALPVAVAMSVPLGESSRVLVNPKFVALFGLTEAEIASSDDWWGLLFPHDGERARVAAEWRMRERDPTAPELPAVTMEARRKPKDGSACVVDVFFSHLRGASLVAFVDITARKKDELALRFERDRNQRYLDIAELMIVALDLDGTITLLNRKGCEILGVSEGEAIGRNWFESFVPAAEREKHKAGFKDYLRNPSADLRSVELPVQTRSGETRLISGNRTVLLGDDGKVVGVMGAGVEVTDQRKAEQKRDEFRALLEATAEASPDGIMVSDASGRYLFWNERYKEMWGLSDDYIRLRQAGPPLTAEVLKPFTDQLLVPESFVKSSIDILVHRRIPVPVSHELALKDGRIFIRYAAMVSPSKLPFAAIAWVYHDVSEQRRQERAAYQALEEASLTDPLTGLRNRRFLKQHIEADVALTLRHYEQWLRVPAGVSPLAADMVFFLIDIDNFKEVNDRYGHGVGDKVLVHMRQRLQEVFRASDHLVRWGGEEFLVVARAVNREEAEGVAERLRKAVAGRAFELDENLRLSASCSIGFACFPFLPAHPRLFSWSEVVELADQALYMAKRGGRNAWVGLLPTARTPTEIDPQSLVRAPEQALRNGELRLAASSAGERVAASPAPG